MLERHSNRNPKQDLCPSIHAEIKHDAFKRRLGKCRCPKCITVLTSEDFGTVTRADSQINSDRSLSKDSYTNITDQTDTSDKNIESNGKLISPILDAEERYRQLSGSSGFSFELPSDILDKDSETELEVVGVKTSRKQAKGMNGLKPSDNCPTLVNMLQGGLSNEQERNRTKMEFSSRNQQQVAFRTIKESINAVVAVCAPQVIHNSSLTKKDVECSDELKNGDLFVNRQAILLRNKNSGISKTANISSPLNIMEQNKNDCVISHNQGLSCHFNSLQRRYTSAHDQERPLDLSVSKNKPMNLTNSQKRTIDSRPPPCIPVNQIPHYGTVRTSSAVLVPQNNTFPHGGMQNFGIRPGQSNVYHKTPVANSYQHVNCATAMPQNLYGHHSSFPAMQNQYVNQSSDQMHQSKIPYVVYNPSDNRTYDQQGNPVLIQYCPSRSDTGTYPARHPAPPNVPNQLSQPQQRFMSPYPRYPRFLPAAGNRVDSRHEQRHPCIPSQQYVRPPTASYSPNHRWANVMTAESYPKSSSPHVLNNRQQAVVTELQTKILNSKEKGPENPMFYKTAIISSENTLRIHSETPPISAYGTAATATATPTPNNVKAHSRDIRHDICWDNVTSQKNSFSTKDSDVAMATNMVLTNPAITASNVPMTSTVTASSNMNPLCMAAKSNMDTLNILRNTNGLSNGDVTATTSCVSNTMPLTTCIVSPVTNVHSALSTTTGSCAAYTKSNSKPNGTPNENVHTQMISPDETVNSPEIPAGIPRETILMGINVTAKESLQNHVFSKDTIASNVASLATSEQHIVPAADVGIDKQSGVSYKIKTLYKQDTVTGNDYVTESGSVHESEAITETLQDKPDIPITVEKISEQTEITQTSSISATCQTAVEHSSGSHLTANLITSGHYDEPAFVDICSEHPKRKTKPPQKKKTSKKKVKRQPKVKYCNSSFKNKPKTKRSFWKVKLSGSKNSRYCSAKTVLRSSESYKDSGKTHKKQRHTGNKSSKDSSKLCRKQKTLKRKSQKRKSKQSKNHCNYIQSDNDTVGYHTDEDDLHQADKNVDIETVGYNEDANNVEVLDNLAYDIRTGDMLHEEFAQGETWEVTEYGKNIIGEQSEIWDGRISDTANESPMKKGKKCIKSGEIDPEMPKIVWFGSLSNHAFNSDEQIEKSCYSNKNTDVKTGVDTSVMPNGLVISTQTSPRCTVAETPKSVNETILPEDADEMPILEKMEPTSQDNTNHVAKETCGYNNVAVALAFNQSKGEIEILSETATESVDIHAVSLASPRHNTIENDGSVSSYNESGNIIRSEMSQINNVNSIENGALLANITGNKSCNKELCDGGVNVTKAKSQTKLVNLSKEYVFSPIKAKLLKSKFLELSSKLQSKIHLDQLNKPVVIDNQKNDTSSSKERNIWDSLRKLSDSDEGTAAKKSASNHLKQTFEIENRKYSADSQIEHHNSKQTAAMVQSGGHDGFDDMAGTMVAEQNENCDKETTDIEMQSKIGEEIVSIGSQKSKNGNDQAIVNDAQQDKSDIGSNHDNVDCVNDIKQSTTYSNSSWKKSNVSRKTQKKYKGSMFMGLLLNRIDSQTGKDGTPRVHNKNYVRKHGPSREGLNVTLSSSPKKPKLNIKVNSDQFPDGKQVKVKHMNLIANVSRKFNSRQRYKSKTEIVSVHLNKNDLRNNKEKLCPILANENCNSIHVIEAKHRNCVKRPAESSSKSNENVSANLLQSRKGSYQKSTNVAKRQKKDSVSLKQVVHANTAIKQSNGDVQADKDSLVSKFKVLHSNAEKNMSNLDQKFGKYFLVQNQKHKNYGYQIIDCEKFSSTQNLTVLHKGTFSTLIKDKEYAGLKIVKDINHEYTHSFVLYEMFKDICHISEKTKGLAKKLLQLFKLLEIVTKPMAIKDQEFYVAFYDSKIYRTGLLVSLKDVQKTFTEMCNKLHWFNWISLTNVSDPFVLRQNGRYFVSLNHVHDKLFASVKLGALERALKLYNIDMPFASAREKHQMQKKLPNLMSYCKIVPIDELSSHLQLLKLYLHVR